ncbi:MAG TPA: hypothetical protein VJZ76_07105 [Thermoanaerobaculia bacterium]|nr:hypothetical protein [Thermoanaerobaculia bacterium]
MGLKTFGLVLSAAVALTCCALGAEEERCTNPSAALNGAVELNGALYLVGSRGGTLCVDRWDAAARRYVSAAAAPASAKDVFVAGIAVRDLKSVDVLLGRLSDWQVWRIESVAAGVRMRRAWQGTIEGPRVAFAVGPTKALLFTQDQADVIDGDHLCGQWPLGEIRSNIHGADAFGDSILITSGSEIAEIIIDEKSCSSPPVRLRRFVGSVGEASWEARSIVAQVNDKLLVLDQTLSVRQAFAGTRNLHSMTTVGDAVVAVSDSKAFVVREGRMSSVAGPFANWHAFRSAVATPLFLTDGESVRLLEALTSAEPLKIVVLRTPLGTVVQRRSVFAGFVITMISAAVLLTAAVVYWRTRRA